MEFKTEILPSDWSTLRKMAREGLLTFSEALIDKIKAGDRNWTEDNAIEVHLATHGAIPCWALRPKTWQPGQVPPSVHSSSLPVAS